MGRVGGRERDLREDGREREKQLKMVFAHKVNPLFFGNTAI